ncbi:MAG: UDP-glucose 4-epimerase GalE [Porticoccaceae bacterium]
MTILVTGGAGYIGSHACVALLDAGYDIVVIDSLINSSRVAPERVARITGKTFPLVIADVGDEGALDSLFAAHPIRAVMHFAGLKAVGESVMLPLTYYRNNIGGTLALCAAMRKRGVGTLIFSSSATVYGDPATVPVTEDFPLQATNPYGRTKLMTEQILRDLVAADHTAGTPFWNVALLRYFNPVGAHVSGTLGEDPRGIPNNLLPYIARVAVGKLEELSIFGDDYATRDGTGVRDYIHVMDLVDGHIKALEKLLAKDGTTACQTWNLGTGAGYTVLEMVAAFAAASGKAVPYRIAPRRPGDIAACWADPARAEKELGWRAARSLADMMADTWRWQRNNPDGFRD